MVRLLTIFLFTVLSFTSVGATGHDVVYSERMFGAEGFSSIDPLVNATDQLAGFIYSDHANVQLIIDDFERDSLVVVKLSGAPEKTVHYYSPQGDSLYVYVLLEQLGQTPKIALVTLSGASIEMKVVHPDCFSGFGLLTAVVSRDLGLERQANGDIIGVRFEAVLEYAERVMGLGTSSETFSTTIVYSPDLETELIRDDVSGLRSGNFYGDDRIEFLGFTNYTYGYDFTESGGDPARGGMNLSTIVLRDSTDMRAVELTTPKGHIRSVLSGNFDPVTEFDEIVIAGRTEDLEGILSGLNDRIACYSFEDQLVTRLWYLDDSLTEVTYVYHDRNVLVGTVGGESVRFIDYILGSVVDSVNLGRHLDNIAFFETYTDPSTLNLVGRSADTIFVYRFDISTRAVSVETEQQPVPATYRLLQNHPNPFNAETRLSFENEVTQFLSLKIYNILGQEVATLAEGVFSPGTYYAYWNGNDNSGISQSSGIYFGKLRAEDNSSQIIKLIFLK